MRHSMIEIFRGAVRVKGPAQRPSAVKPPVLELDAPDVLINNPNPVNPALS